MHRQLTVGLALLGAGIAAAAVLGPLVTGVLEYRTSELARNQIVGGDAAALVVVAPVCVALAVLAARGHRAAPVLALAPAFFALYLYSQLIMGNEYGQLPGNVERFFPLLLAVVLVAAWVAVAAWRAVPESSLPATTRRYDRIVGTVLLLLAAYVLVGIHLGTYLDVVRDTPTDEQYLSAPTAFWAVKLWDLSVVVPGAAVVGVGMLRGRQWASKPMYGLLGGYLLLGCSVTGMAWTMYAQGDPGSSLAQALTLTVAVALLAVAAARLYRPLFRSAAVPGPREADAEPVPAGSGSGLAR
jgi:hypothetical protein